MNEADTGRSVLVLTERPEEYDDLRRLGLEPRFVPNTSALLSCLATSRACGIVLEVDKVLRAPSLEREQLFQLSEIFPLLRAKPELAGRGAAFMDDPERFAAAAQRFAPRSLRHVPRVPVLLRGLLAPVENPQARPVLVNILDLSFEGGYLNSDTDLGPSQDVGLRILGLTDPEPVRASICWRKTTGGAKTRHAAGLRFMYLRPGQAEELRLRYLEPALDQG